MDQNFENQRPYGYDENGQLTHPTQVVPMIEQVAPDPTSDLQAKLDNEQLKSRILAATTALACVLAFGLGVWGVTRSSAPAQPTLASGQYLDGGQSDQNSQDGQGGLGDLDNQDNQGSQDGQGDLGGLGDLIPEGKSGQGGQVDPNELLNNLLNSDGSFNLEGLEGLANGNLQDLDVNKLLGQAESSGLITEEQANTLKSAIESLSGILSS